MNHNTKKVKELYEKSTDVYLRVTGYYIHGCAPPDSFNLTTHILKQLNVKSGSVVLDCGCGMGKMLVDMAEIQPNIQFLGVTISEQQIKIANRLKIENNVKNVEFILGDFHHLSDYFKVNSLDAVFFNESLFHSDNYKQVLFEVKKVLKHQGVLYSKDFYINRRIYKYIPFLKAYKLIKYIKNHYFYHPILPGQMISTLKTFGFNVKHFEKPPYISDFQKVIDFEKAYGLQTYKLIQKVNAIHWRELVAINKNI